VDGAWAVHTVQGKHVRKSGEDNSLPEMGELTRLLIDANRDSPSFSGKRTLKDAQLKWYEAVVQRERSLTRFLDLGSRYLETLIAEKEKD